MIEGYGSTETFGVITASIFGDLAGNHVGPPLPICEIKLVDVPGMGLIAIRDNRGEVWSNKMTFLLLLIFSTLKIFIFHYTNLASLFIEKSVHCSVSIPHFNFLFGKIFYLSFVLEIFKMIWDLFQNQQIFSIVGRFLRTAFLW